ARGPGGDGRGARLRRVVRAREAVVGAGGVVRAAAAAVRGRVSVAHHTVERAFDREQRATHGLAWLATYVEAVRQLAAWADRLNVAGRLGETELLVAEIGLGEYLAQILGGIPMSQGEIVRPADVGLPSPAVAARMAGPLEGLMSGRPDCRARL